MAAKKLPTAAKITNAPAISINALAGTANFFFPVVLILRARINEK